MPAIYEHAHTVSASDVDEQGHVSNLAYLEWMQSAAVAHSKAQGWDAQRYKEAGSAWVVRSHKIEYLQPAFVGQNVIVLTWVSNFKKIQSLRKYKAIRAEDNVVLAVAETNWAFIGSEHRVPRRVPAELRDAFELVPVESEP